MAEKPLHKADLKRTPGTPAERVRMIAQGWSATPPKKAAEKAPDKPKS